MEHEKRLMIDMMKNLVRALEKQNELLKMQNDILHKLTDNKKGEDNGN